MSEAMTDRQVALFEQGFASYADGIPHDHVPAFPDIEERRWWLKGWYASKRTNRFQTESK
jgi:ribosome modulation factor